MVVAVAVAGGWYWLRPEPAIEVATVIVRQAQSEVSGTVLNASGYVTARRQATVSSKVTGKVVEILIEEGMRVEQGQVLARLDDSNIRTNLELAQAQLHSARTALKETEALLTEAELNLERTRELAEKGLASEAELDRNRALTQSLAARLELREAEVTVASKALAVYEQQIDDMVIRAPFSGIVVAKNAQPGEMISPISAGGGFTRTGIGTVVDMDSLEIEIDVNEAYINRVSPGQPVIATLDSYPQWKIPCHVIAIIPTADRQKATVEVRVGFNELDTRILPDMGVKVGFKDTTERPARVSGALIPESALQAVDGKDVIWVFNDGVAERRAVSTAGKVGAEVLVSAGLTAGERIIVNAVDGLVDGVKVSERSE